MKLLFSVFIISTLLSACASSNPMKLTIADVAERDIGKTNKQMGIPNTLSCADGMNKWRREVGISEVASRRAIDQSIGGVHVLYPKRGDLLISKRGNIGHHVDVITSVDGGSVVVVGANVNKKVLMRKLPIAGNKIIRLMSL